MGQYFGPLHKSDIWARVRGRLDMFRILGNNFFLSVGVFGAVIGFCLESGQDGKLSFLELD